MKTKNISLALGVMFAFVFAISLVSAASLSITNIVTPANVDHDAGSFDITFDLTNSGDAGSIDWTGSSVSNSATLSFDLSNIAEGTVTPVTESVTATVSFAAHKSGSFTGTVSADPSGLGATQTFNFNVLINDKSELALSTTGTLSKSTNATLKVKNEGNVNLGVDLSEVTSFGLIFENTGTISLTPGEEESVLVSLPVNVDLDFGTNNVQIRARDASEGLDETFNIGVLEGFCSSGPAGNDLEITDVKINNLGSGKDDEWKLLDTVEIEVRVDNNGAVDIKDVFVEIGLFDSRGADQINDLEFEDSDEERYDLGKIKDGKDEKAIFKFKVPADVEDGSYKLAVKAYSDDLGEEVECTDSSNDLSDDTFEDISIDRESDNGKFIAFDNVRFIPEQAACGETVAMTLDVFNIGDEDQDRVKVVLQNRDLDVDQSHEITRGLDQGDDSRLNFEFTIPQNLENKIYPLELTSQYDYNRGTYREVSDGIQSFGLRVSGCSAGGSSGSSGSGSSGSGQTAAINAFLDSDAMAGEELVVRATVTNLMDDTASFVVDALSFESWATLKGVTNSILALNAGESRDVTFRFDVDEDATGEESFVVEARDATSGEFEAREVAVNIDDGKGTGSGITGASIGFGDNAYLWIIGIINVILVILIIVVAVRISRR